MKIKFVVLLLLGIFMISLVSAEWYNPLTWFSSAEDNQISAFSGVDEIDTVWVGLEIEDVISDKEYIDLIRTEDSEIIKNNLTKFYDVSEKRLKIYDDKETKIEMSLLTPYENKVGVGESTKIAEYILIDWSDKEGVVDSIDSYDIKNKYNEIQKQYIWKYYQGENNIEYIEVSNKTKENETICWNEFNVYWIEFDSLNDLPNKNITVGLFTSTELGDHVEIIPTIEGFKILEYSSWEAVVDAHGVTYTGFSEIRTTERGFQIKPYEDLILNEVEQHASSTCTIGYVRYAGNQTLINSTTFIGKTVSFNNLLKANVSYYVVCDNGGSNYRSDWAKYDTPSLMPFTGTHIEWTGSIREVDFGSPPNENWWYTIISVTTSSVPSGDTTPPTYSDNQTNNTNAGQSTLFSILWDDDTALNASGQYIFSTNNTGEWTNDSAINFTTTPSWANVTKTLNSTGGISIGYRWYATDNAQNANSTEIFTLTTVGLPTISISRIYPTTNINVTQNEFFNVTLNVTCLTGSCGTVNVSLDPEPIESHTSSTDTICNNGICNKVLYSGTRNVFEDNQWKKIENARSLKDKGFDIVYLEDDGTHEIDVVDFNMTYIEFDFSYNENNLGEYEIEEGKMKTKWKIIEEVCNETDCWEEETEHEIEIEEEKKQTIVYNGNPLGKEFHLGEESTTIQIIDNVTGNLGDTWVSGYYSDADVGDYWQLDIFDSSYYTKHIFIKFNISDILSDYTILSSSLSLYAFFNLLDDDTEGYNISSHHVYQYPTFNISNSPWFEGDEFNRFGGCYENTLCYNTKPQTNEYNSTSTDDMYIFGGTGEPLNLLSWDVTNSVDIGKSDDNITFMLFAHDYFGSPDPGDDMQIFSKEYINDVLKRPYLNITYTEAQSEEKSGLINTTIGALPFYTNSTNPYTTNSLSSGQSETINFWVNATGELDITHDFFAWANMTSNETVSNITTHWNVTIVAEIPEDTCTYTSGDWNVDCSDNCVISSPVDIGNNDIIITGTGTFLTSEDIIGYDRLHIEGTDASNICRVTCIGGCFR